MKVHVEYLFHFSCLNCNKWWTVGDYCNLSRPLQVSGIDYFNRQIYCPHCRTQYSIDEIVNGFEDTLYESNKLGS